MTRRIIFSVLLTGAFHLSSFAQTFAFHNRFWANLHFFLYDQALKKRANGRYMPAGKFRDTLNLDVLNGGEQEGWRSAIFYYQTHMITRDLLFDTTIIRLKNRLEDLDDQTVLNDYHLPVELQQNLNAVAASYRSRFWKLQQKQNEAWISNAGKLLSQYGDQIKEQLAGLYQMKWPGTTITVDVTNYARWTGAYTTRHPDRVTISSIDTNNQHITALEVVFHEASHLLSDTIFNRIRLLCPKNHQIPPDGLDHAILFYTTGVVIKSHFHDYLPYAYQVGIWKKVWPVYLACLERDWQPYIDKKVSFDTAILNLVTDVLANTKK